MKHEDIRVGHIVIWCRADCLVDKKKKKVHIKDRTGQGHWVWARNIEVAKTVCPGCKGASAGWWTNEPGRRNCCLICGGRRKVEAYFVNCPKCDRLIVNPGDHCYCCGLRIDVRFVGELGGVRMRAMIERCGRECTECNALMPVDMSECPLCVKVPPGLGMGCWRDAVDGAFFLPD